jgi:protein gp37
MAKRLKAMGNPNYENGFDLTLHEKSLDIPLGWKTPQFIFVNSMSDLFHEDVPLEFVKRVFDTMRRADWHIFQVLTKRSERMLEMNEEIEWPTNVWMGVSIETEQYTYRIDHLRQTDANIKFLSLEPLLGPIVNLELKGVDWVIVGGESGPYSRPIKESWVIEIKNQCIDNSVPFFFKQWGGTNKKKAGRLLEGKTWNNMPKSMPCMSL